MTDTKEPWLEPVARKICAVIAHGGEHDSEKFVERYWPNCEEQARAAYAELQRLGEIGIPDNPEFDATDGAHPAWWRGEDYGARSVVREMLKAFTEPHHNGKFSMPEMNELREKIWTLRENQRTPGTVEVCARCKEPPRNDCAGVVLPEIDSDGGIIGVRSPCPIKGAP